MHRGAIAADVRQFILPTRHHVTHVDGAPRHRRVQVRLQGCALQDNKVAHELGALSAGAVRAPRNASVGRQLGARYYADVAMSGLSVWRGGSAPECPLSAGPAHPQPLQSVPPATQFLGEDDEWFVNIQRVRFPCCKTACCKNTWTDPHNCRDAHWCC